MDEYTEMNFRTVEPRPGRAATTLGAGMRTPQESARFIAERVAARQRATVLFCAWHHGVIGVVPGPAHITDTCCDECMSKYFGGMA